MSDRDTVTGSTAVDFVLGIAIGIILILAYALGYTVGKTH